MVVKMIVCYDSNFGIGNKNKLLYHISNDLKRFRKLTEHQIIVMGRSTYESLNKDILPNRINVVLTRDKKYKPKNSNVIVMHDIGTILNHYHSGHQDKDLIIIGGSELYSQFVHEADVIHVTEIFDYKDADSHFEINEEFDEFIPYKIETHITEDEVFYQFIDYVRNTYFKEYHELQLNK